METKTYRTIQGDCWDSIAYKLWGKEVLAHKLMQANPNYMDILVFGAGVELSIPDIQIEKSTENLPEWI